MKNSLRTRLICCWLAFVVLLGSTGFGMVDHWCQVRGHTKSLLLTKNDCSFHCQWGVASEPATAQCTVKRIPCCKTRLSYEHLDVSRFSDNQPNPAPPQPAECISNSAFVPVPATLLPANTLTPSISATDDPLFRTRRFRLMALCTWLIRAWHPAFRSLTNWFPAPDPVRGHWPDGQLGDVNLYSDDALVLSRFSVINKFLV